jgi:hypothetical protein
MKPGDFRIWLGRQWEEHKMEFEGYEGKLPDYNTKTWFNRYKYWLIREFKHEMRFKKVDKS